jgi:hypothetical protein
LTLDSCDFPQSWLVNNATLDQSCLRNIQMSTSVHHVEYLTFNFRVQTILAENLFYKSDISAVQNAAAGYYILRCAAWFNTVWPLCKTDQISVSKALHLHCCWSLSCFISKWISRFLALIPNYTWHLLHLQIVQVIRCFNY